MMEYNIATIFTTFILGVGKFALVAMTIYVPLHMFAAAISFKKWL